MKYKTKHLAYAPKVGAHASLWPEDSFYEAPNSIMLYGLKEGRWRAWYYLPADVEIPDEAIIHYSLGERFYSWMVPENLRDSVEGETSGIVIPDPEYQKGEWLPMPLFNEYRFYEIVTKTTVALRTDTNTELPAGEDPNVPVPVNDMFGPRHTGAFAGEIVHVAQSVHSQEAKEHVAEIAKAPVCQPLKDHSIIIGRKSSGKFVNFYDGSAYMHVDTTVYDVTEGPTEEEIQDGNDSN